MKGARPLDNNEISRVSACFTGTFEIWNRGLFILGVSTGGRISELLSLTLELALHSYDLSRFWDNETIGEIVKIS
jgi:hypothetical protein